MYGIVLITATTWRIRLQDINSPSHHCHFLLVSFGEKKKEEKKKASCVQGIHPPQLDTMHNAQCTMPNGAGWVASRSPARNKVAEHKALAGWILLGFP